MATDPNHSLGLLIIAKSSLGILTSTYEWLPQRQSYIPIPPVSFNAIMVVNGLANSFASVGNSEAFFRHNE